jgi:Flp pilus assembly protein TadG
MCPLHVSKRRRGTVAVVVALSLTGLFGYVALACDGGFLLADHQRAQAAADASAMAAASCLYQHYPRDAGLDPQGIAVQAALDEASHNGYGNDSTKTVTDIEATTATATATTTNGNGDTLSVVTVNIPPTSGPYKGQASFVEVLLTYYQPRYFSSIFGTGSIPVKVRAVARGAWVVPNAGVIVLDYTGKGTLNDQGNGAFTEVGAPVIVNSNDPAAALDTGNGIIKAPEFDITGNYAITGNGQLLTNPIANNILTGVHPTPDPLAYLPVPDVPAAGNLSKTSIGHGNFAYLLTPGAYTNLPSFNSGDVVVFQQASGGALYYLRSGGLNSQGASLIMDPNTSGGITIYNAGTGTNDKINITGNSSGTVNLSPPSTGPYTGLAIFQARNASQNMQIAGNGTFTIYGTIYGAAALLKVSGNGAVSNIGSQYITKDLSITGNGNVTITWQAALLARTRIITLVE